MNVSVLKPSGDFIARFEIARIEDLPDKLQELLSAGMRLPLRSRVEAAGQCWVIAGFNPIQLREEARRAVSAATPVIETEWRRHGSRAGRSAARSQMMIGLCWCIGGLIVTVGTYLAAASGPAGGSYFVAWGAIVFGGIRFFKGFANLRDE